MAEQLGRFALRVKEILEEVGGEAIPEQIERKLEEDPGWRGCYFRSDVLEAIDDIVSSGLAEYDRVACVRLKPAAIGTMPDYACSFPCYTFRGYSMGEAFGKLSRWQRINELDDESAEEVVATTYMEVNPEGRKVYSVVVDWPAKLQEDLVGEFREEIEL